MYNAHVDIIVHVCLHKFVYVGVYPTYILMHAHVQYTCTMHMLKLLYMHACISLCMLVCMKLLYRHACISLCMLVCMLHILMYTHVQYTCTMHLYNAHVAIVQNRY